MIEVTNIKIDIVKNNKILAYATVTINDCIIISGIRLYEGDKGKFIVFPTRISGKGRKFNIAFPCNDETRSIILKNIEKVYLSKILE